MTEPAYSIEDLGDRRVLTVGGREYSTAYSARVVRMLVERKGPARAPQYFSFKETRGRLFLDPLFAYLHGRGAGDLSVLEVGCSFGHITEYLAAHPDVQDITTFETHSVGLPLIQWLPAPAAYAYAKLGRPRRFRGVGYGEFVADGTGWRNASLAECLPSSELRGLEDVTEEAGYGWRFFLDTARSRTRRALLPVFGIVCGALRCLGLSPSLALPYLNVVLRKQSAQ